MTKKLGSIKREMMNLFKNVKSEQNQSLKPSKNLRSLISKFGYYNTIHLNYIVRPLCPSKERSATKWHTDKIDYMVLCSYPTPTEFLHDDAYEAGDLIEITPEDIHRAPVNQDSYPRIVLKAFNFIPKVVGN